MTREGTWRSVVVPVLVTTAVVVAFVFCVFQALADSRFADDLHGGYGGLGAGVAVGILTSVGTRRAQERAKELLPATLTATQRDQVVVAARSGPLPADPAVRIEARRLAEQWAAARGRDLRVTAVVFAVLAAGCAVGGAVSSPWWWGDGALLAGLAGLAVWRDRQRGQQLRTLRQHTELPEPPTEGVHRLVDGERTRDLAAADRAALELTIRKPWGGGTTISSTMVRINGALVPSEWGHNRFLVPAGTLTVSVWIVYLSEYGRATTTLTLPAGDQTELHYSPPALTLLDGRIGPDPQRSPGARGLAVFALAFVALLVVLIVLFP